MKQKLHLWIIPVFLLCAILFSLGCKGAPTSTNPTTTSTTGTIIFVNQTGQRLRGYIDGIFQSFIEIGQTRTYDKIPPGSHELKADNFGSGVWGPTQINLVAGQTWTWTLR